MYTIHKAHPPPARPIQERPETGTHPVAVAEYSALLDAARHAPVSYRELRRRNSPRQEVPA